MSRDIFTNKKTLPMAEIFGPTTQGEGNRVGEKVYFIRFSGCDFRCAWCDSEYTHRVTPNTKYYTVPQLLDLVDALPGKADGIVITGGNPALYDLEAFIHELHDRDLKVHIETQGSIFPSWLRLVDYVVFSPKPPSSKMSEKYDKSNLVYELNKFSRDRADDNRENGTSKTVIVKTPIFDDIDYEWTKDLFKKLTHMDRKYFSVGNANSSPDDDKETVVQGILKAYGWLQDKVLADDDLLDISVLPQLHALLWGTMTGV